jgi:hypothetical protein
MAKRMTVVFDDEELYRALKVESARLGQPARDIVSDALREWLERREDEEISNELDEARREWQQEGGEEASAFFAARR